MLTLRVGECTAAEGQSSSGPAQKVPLVCFSEPSSLFLSLPQLLEATHPNTAGHAPSHRPFEVFFMQKRWPGCSMQSLAHGNGNGCKNTKKDGVAAFRAVLATHTKGDPGTHG